MKAKDWALWCLVLVLIWCLWSRTADPRPRGSLLRSLIRTVAAAVFLFGDDSTPPTPNYQTHQFANGEPVRSSDVNGLVSIDHGYGW